MGGLLTLFDPVAVPKHDIKPSSWDSTRVRHLLGDLLELVVCSVDCGAELCESHAETCAMCRARSLPLNFIVVPARIMPERAHPASASGHCSRPLFSLSHRAYTFGTVHSSTPTTEELLNRAKDLIRQNREYLEHFNAVI